MSGLRDVATAVAILAGTVGGVAAATMGLTALIIPASATGVATATPVPTFDLAVAPTAIGGQLAVSGDRSGTLLFESASGIGGRHQAGEDGTILILPDTPPALSGPDGRITFERDTGDVTLIEFDDLSLYLDPGECLITEGAINEEAGLMAALVECPDIADVRGDGVVSVAGVVALPIEIVRGRAGLPQSGGTVEVGGTPLTLDETVLFLDTAPDDDGRITAGTFTEDGGMAFEYDPAAERFYLTQVSVGDLYAVASEPCPITAHDLGRLSDTTTVVRMEIDCTDWADAEGDLVTVAGTVVADVIQGLADNLEP